jgi:hypothetical protein
MEVCSPILAIFSDFTIHVSPDRYFFRFELASLKPLQLNHAQSFSTPSLASNTSKEQEGALEGFESPE